MLKIPHSRGNADVSLVSSPSAPINRGIRRTVKSWAMLWGRRTLDSVRGESASDLSAGKTRGALWPQVPGCAALLRLRHQVPADVYGLVVLEPGIPDAVGAGWLLLRPLCSACRRPPSPWVLPGSVSGRLSPQLPFLQGCQLHGVIGLILLSVL